MIVTFDGVDGAGKTTIVGALARKLKEQGHKVLTHHFPTYENVPRGNTPRDKANSYLSDMGYTFINKINPFLEENKDGIVLIDRFKWTTFAYNLWEPFKDDEDVLNRWIEFIKESVPAADVEFFVSVEYETCKARKNEMTPDHFESVTGAYISAKINHGAFEFMLDGELPKDKIVSLAETVIKSVMLRKDKDDLTQKTVTT